MSTDDAPGDPGWDDLDAETKHEILALANTINDDASKVTRRDLLAGAGAVGAGALLGGGATQALSEPAAASHGGATIGTSGDPIEMIHTEGVSSLNSLAADEIDNEVRIRPDDDIQSRLDALNTETGRVGQPKWFVAKLDPNTTYEVSSTIDIPEYTVLDLNGAKVRPASDFNIIRLGSPGAHLADSGQSRVTAGSVSLTNPVVLVDTTDFGNNINQRFDNTVGVLGHPELVTGFGDGIGLKLDSSNQQILEGNRFEVKISGPQDHIVLETNNGNSINGCEFSVQLGKWCGGKNIVHRNTAGSAGEAAVNVYGVIQCDSNSTHAIHNETGVGASIRFQGQLWDPTTPTTAAVGGAHVRVDPNTNLPESAVSFGTGTTVNGVSYQALAGASPDATNWQIGDVIHDTDNPGTLHLVYGDSASGDVTQIGT